MSDTLPILTAGALISVLAELAPDTELVVDLGALDEFFEIRVRTVLPARPALPAVLVFETGQEVTLEKHLMSRSNDYLGLS